MDEHCFEVGNVTTARHSDLFIFCANETGYLLRIEKGCSAGGQSFPEMGAQQVAKQQPAAAVALLDLRLDCEATLDAAPCLGVQRGKLKPSLLAPAWPTCRATRLWDGGPGGVALDPLPHLWVGQHVAGPVLNACKGWGGGWEKCDQPARKKAVPAAFGSPDRGRET